MLAHVLAPALMRRGIHYGWVMVALTFLTMLSTAAAMGLPGVLIGPLQSEYGWKIGEISGALALRLVLFGLVAPFAAALIARFGILRVVGVGLILIVGGVGLATRMDSLWQLWLSWGLMVGFGTGLTALVLGATVANRWFTKRRGLVMGLLTASNATGQLLFLPVDAWLVEHEGWRLAVLPPLLACGAAWLLMILLGRDHPAQVGLPPYGEAVVLPLPQPPRGNPFLASLVVLRDAARDRTFWVLFGTFFVCGLSTNGLVQSHFIPFCVDYGLSAQTGASVLAMMGMFDFFGTIVSGWLSDRYDVRRLLFAYYGLRGLSLIALPYSSFTFFGLSLFAMFYGLDWVATVPPTVKLAAARFGRERAALVFGWVFTAHQLGAAVAAAGAGMVRDGTGTYLPAFLAAGVACLVAAVAALSPRRLVNT
jgi:sugar phosphate permease